jgi:putative acetyltransferase
MAIQIRPEQPDDFGAIREVVAAAFESSVEADLVEAIRADACYRPQLALVAVDEADGRVVGHVMIDHAELHDGGGDGSRDGRTVHRVGMLSPLAVAPDRQRQGIGSALVREAVARADAAGDPLVVLEGSPRYYPRFGFVDCRTLGITIHLPDWAPPDAGQALPLSAYHASVRGTLVHPPPFEGLD